MANPACPCTILCPPAPASVVGSCSVPCMHTDTGATCMCLHDATPRRRHSCWCLRRAVYTLGAAVMMLCSRYISYVACMSILSTSLSRLLLHFVSDLKETTRLLARGVDEVIRCSVLESYLDSSGRLRREHRVLHLRGVTPLYYPFFPGCIACMY